MEQQPLPLDKKKKITRTYLSPKDNFAVTQLVLAEFAEKKITDEAFAEYAKEKLSLSFCSQHHITGIRNAFNIPCEVRKTKVAAAAVAEERAHLLDRCLTAAEAQIRHLFADIARLEKLVQPAVQGAIRYGNQG